MSMAVDVAAMGAAYNSPAVARDMVQTAAVGSIISAQDAARQSMPSVASTGSGSYSTGAQAYHEALANTSVQAQQTLMQLTSQNQVLETLSRSL